METSHTPENQQPSMKKRIGLLTTFTAAFSLTWASLSSLFLWHREYHKSVAQYSTRTVLSSDEEHAMVIVGAPSQDRKQKETAFLLRSPDDWKSLRDTLARDIQQMTADTAQKDLVDATIRKIDEDVQRVSAGGDELVHEVTVTQQRATQGGGAEVSGYSAQSGYTARAMGEISGQYTAARRDNELGDDYSGQYGATRRPTER